MSGVVINDFGKRIKLPSKKILLMTFLVNSIISIMLIIYFVSPHNLSRQDVYFVLFWGNLILFFPCHIALSAYFLRKNKLEINKLKYKFIEFIGSHPQYFEFNVVDTKDNNDVKAATGIAYDNKNIFLLDEGVAARIPWSSIREWTCHIKGHNEYLGTGSYAVKAKIETARSKIISEANSGFFLTVACIEKPEWHFSSADEKVLKKWMEIFNQINDGKLPIERD